MLRPEITRYGLLILLTVQVCQIMFFFINSQLDYVL